MKNQLEKWGFTHTGGYEQFTYHALENGTISIVVALDDEQIERVAFRIGDHTVQIPNCDNKLALFTLLYNFDLIEV